jgi:hypothetical protein
LTENGNIRKIAADFAAEAIYSATMDVLVSMDVEDKTEFRQTSRIDSLGQYIVSGLF